MDSETSKYIKALSSMREDDFTRKILKPLFEAMGYERVDFNGGPLERGRDLICQRRIPPRRTMRVTYIQSKKIDDIQNTSTAAKLSTLIHQLRQCCKGIITTIDGHELSADEVYLACPEQISNRLMDELSAQLFSIDPKVQFYDGPQIVSDIFEYKPDLIKLLATIEDKLTRTQNSNLFNAELLSALKSKNKAQTSNFYSDLSFFVGSIDSNILFHLNLKIDSQFLNLEESAWNLLKTEHAIFLKNYSVETIVGNLLEMEKTYKELKEKHNSKENKNNIDTMASLLQRKASLISSIENYINSLEKQFDPKIGTTIKGIEPDKLLECNNYINYLKDLYKTGSKEEPSKHQIRKTNKAFEKGITDMISFIKEINLITEQLNELELLIVKKPEYNIEINKNSILSKLNEYQERYFNDVIAINKHELGLSNLSRFLYETEQTLSFIAKLSDKDFPLAKSLKFGQASLKQDRVSISPHDIFATGHDIAVYGGAGVGKTTTLQAYSELMSSNPNKTLFYIPLNRLAEKIEKLINETRSNVLSKDDIKLPDESKTSTISKNEIDSKIEESKKLKRDWLLRIILMSKDIDPTEENIKNAKHTLPHGIILVLDGLDEVYTTLPDIIPAIYEFKKSFPNSQLIISSRDCVSYLEDIKFLGITLLPFTKDQLDKFILGWLDDKIKAQKLISTVNKLDLYDKIKTPLLATITCSLVEKGLKIPTTENEIYSERLRLLTGDYDIHKNISRQEIKGDLLRKCAQSLAYAMHRQKTRNLFKEQMFKLLAHDLSDHFEHVLLLQCLDELIDPCNVIVKDPLTSTYSFGHLRFQEHLASCELRSNRGIDLSELVINDWWRGALCLYAQENEFFNLFEEVYNKYHSILNAKVTFEAMINVSPKNKRKGLWEIFEQYKTSDDYDFSFEIDHDNYDDVYLPIQRYF